jgi:lysyl-tRNA synthetase class 2
MDIELLRTRAAIFREIRSFFDGRSYLEVDTPLLAPDLIPESCLEVFETARILPAGGGTAAGGIRKPYWLVPSPEIWMKKLIAKHRESMYQICKCFRNGESSGGTHSPEFTMLEYYTMNADYKDTLKITEELFTRLLSDTHIVPREAALRPPFLRITMAEAFSQWAGFDLFKAAEQGGLAEEARRLGLDPSSAPAGSLDTAALYDLIFIHAVEPNLPKDRPTAILDYPAFVPCLAKKSPDGKTVERWELYINGIELANCYSEERDGETVRRYFAAEGGVKERTALVPHAADENYWMFFRDFPRCSGAAMGLDRLVMVLTGVSRIDAVLPFPMEDPI